MRSLANAISFPACISSAISVGSTTKQNAISGFSNSASFLSLLAPGSAIISSVPGGGYGTFSGTSMAAPHVAGAWAVLKSAKPSATVSQVLTALQNSGVPITDGRNGVVKSLIQIGDTASQFGATGVLLGQTTPPSVSLTAPTGGANFVAPANVTVTANASATRAQIARVEFYSGANKIHETLAASSHIHMGRRSHGQLHAHRARVRQRRRHGGFAAGRYFGQGHPGRLFR
jgi:subtilisin family serine protease